MEIYNNMNIFTSPALQEEQEIFPSFAFVMNDSQLKNDLFNSMKHVEFPSKFDNDTASNCFRFSFEEMPEHQENSTDLSLSNKDKAVLSDPETDSMSSSPKEATSHDYNKWVDEILDLSDNKDEESIEKNKEVVIRNRRKLTKKELTFLEEEYCKTQGQDWDKAYITMLAKKVNLPYYKVYKWNWDRKKKDLQPHRQVLKLANSS